MRRVSKSELKFLLGNRIKEIRELKGYTQEHLAIKMGFKDKQIVNRYEKDGANPTTYSLIQICEALETTIPELLNFLELET
jgi:transcriptional regulator with XRE-family HTH domain